MRLDHEKLHVYRLALAFVGHADAVAARLPRGRAYLADQLRRAATSVVLNIAEGAGEFSGPDKARFYRMARRSATECAAILDVCGALALGEPEPLAQGRAVLARLVAMLTRMTAARQRPRAGADDAQA